MHIILSIAVWAVIFWKGIEPRMANRYGCLPILILWLGWPVFFGATMWIGVNIFGIPIDSKYWTFGGGSMEEVEEREGPMRGL